MNPYEAPARGARLPGLAGRRPATFGWLLIPLLVLMLSGAAWGIEWHAFNGETVESPPRLELLSADQSRVTFEVSIPGMLVEEVFHEGETYHRLRLPGACSTWDIGLPQLPELRRLVGIPGSEGVVVSVKEAATVEIPDLLVYPAQEPATDEDPLPGELVIDEAFYEGTEPYPGRPLVAGPPEVWRDVRVSRLAVRPFTYQPETRTLIASTRMVVEVRFEGEDARNPFSYGERPVLPEWADEYTERIINYESLGLPTWRGKNPGTDLLVITVDALRDSMMALADWHHREGIETDVVDLSLVGTTADDVKDYILARFNQDNISYVLLVGDVNLLPIPYVDTVPTPNIASDHWYACLVGDDLEADIKLARLSVTTSTMVAHQVRKMLTYEISPPVDDWVTRSLLCAYQEDVYRNNKDQIADYSYVYPPPAFEKCYAGMGGTRQQVIDAIEGGTQLVNYRGHGSTQAWSWYIGWGSGHVHALENGEYYCLVFNICCENGRLDSVLETLAEAWMNADHGAAGNLAASRASYRTYNNIMDRALYWAIYDEGFQGTMEVVNWAKGHILGDDYGNANALMYLWLGDPAMQMWTDAPGTMDISHPPIAFMGITDFTVEVSDGGYPIEGARVCVMTEAGDIYEVGYTDPSGSAVLSLAEAASGGDLDVTVTSHDYLPYLTTIPLERSTGPYLVCVERVIDDDSLEDSHGNDDGDLDAGETIELTVTLENVGQSPAPAASATLSSPDSFVQIIDAFEEFGDIPALDSAPCLDDFEMAIEPTAPDGVVADFLLTIISGDSTWYAPFSYSISAPVLSYAYYAVDDGETGDGDGWIDPGETVALTVTLRNSGQAAAYNLNADLLTEDPFVTIEQGSGGCALLPPGEDAALTGPFLIAVLPGCPENYGATLNLSISGDYGYTAGLAFDVVVGAFADDMEGDTGGWDHYAVTEGYGDEWFLTGARNHTPAGAKSWHCAPPDSSHYSNMDDAALVTPDLVIPLGGLVRFWHWMEAQTSFGGYGRDGGIVEITTDGGSTWLQVEPEGGYPTTINAGSGCPFLDGTPCYSGSFDWTQAEFDLAAHAGVARIRFRFGSDATVVMEGWYVDDLEVGRDVSGVEDFHEVDRGVPVRPMLGFGSPNPFNPRTTISYGIPRAAHVRLEVYDVAGRRVRTLVDELRGAGYHQVTWQGTDAEGAAVASGIYFCRLAAGDFSATRKVVLMK